MKRKANAQATVQSLAREITVVAGRARGPAIRHCKSMIRRHELQLDRWRRRLRQLEKATL